MNTLTNTIAILSLVVFWGQQPLTNAATSYTNGTFCRWLDRSISVPVDVTASVVTTNGQWVLQYSEFLTNGGWELVGLPMSSPFTNVTQQVSVPATSGGYFRAVQRQQEIK